MNRTGDTENYRTLTSIKEHDLFVYLPTAIFARIATGGSALAVLLLARHFLLDGSTAGVLAACLTAPHVLGPLYGRWLDGVKEPRFILFCACCLFPATFILAIWALTNHYLILAITALLVGGACSSFLMGGMSTQLIHLVASHQVRQRQAQSWDTISYGIGLTLGPLLLAFLSSATSIQHAIYLVMSLPLISALLLLYFPKRTMQGHGEHLSPMTIKQVVAAIAASMPLRKTLAMTSGGSFAMAALPVLAVFLSESWNGSPDDGAWLVSAYGAGCITGAILLLLRPLRKDAIELLRNIGGILLISITLVLLSQNLFSGIASYWFCGVVNSIFFATTLAARTEHAPKKAAAQVYLWVAAAKISAASLGTVTAGFFIDIWISAPLIAAIGILFSTLLLCFRHQ